MPVCRGAFDEQGDSPVGARGACKTQSSVWRGESIPGRQSVGFVEISSFGMEA